MEVAIEKFAIVSFIVIGLSHIFQHRAWAEFFVQLRGKGIQGAFINALIQFPFGALIVAFHNVWHGIPAILKIYGCALVLKCAINFIYPQLALKSLGRVSLERSWEFALAGAVFLGFAGMLLFSLWARQ
ncbi:MAG: hypothetical protein U0V70_08570 [Terriglobia bacterium]